MIEWHTLRKVFQLAKSMHGAKTLVASLRYFRKQYSSTHYNGLPPENTQQTLLFVLLSVTEEYCT
jgi:hypothetical protein